MHTYPLHLAVSLHLAGFLCGLALYGMLVALSLRRDTTALTSDVLPGHARTWWPSRLGSIDRLPLATGMLGMLWNIGALVVYGMVDLELGPPSALFAAAAYSALGFLPAVAAHSILRPRSLAVPPRTRLGLVAAAYLLSATASCLHTYAALTDRLVPSPAGLRLLTAGFLLLALPLVIVTHKQALWRRTLVLVALAVFAVSAFHLIDHQDFTAPLWLQLLGHHASLPLAVAILLQDYPFAFADLLLKRMLALGAVVSVTLTALVLLVSSPLFEAVPGDLFRPPVLIALLLLVVGIALLYPWMEARVAWFVDAIVLRRADPAVVLASISRLAADSERVDALVDGAGRELAAALSAPAIVWHLHPGPDGAGRTATPQTTPARAVHQWEASGRLRPVMLEAEGRTALVVVPTTEPPLFVAVVGSLAGGRRILSADIDLLQNAGVILARRVDAIRIAHERFDREARGQEMSRLATEAELRALRAQVNPHFLFNALTTIGHLAQTAPDQATRTILRLSDLLRRAFRSDDEMIALGSELELVEAYLDIERARFEDRLHVVVDVPQEVRTVKVPPFLLQPLVENAVKHGIAPSRAGGTVSIAARVQAEPGEAASDNAHTAGRHALVLTVGDTGAGKDGTGRHSDGEGTGLANVERRLVLAYGPGAALTFIGRPGSGAEVRIVIPLAGDIRSSGSVGGADRPGSPS